MNPVIEKKHGGEGAGTLVNSRRMASWDDDRIVRECLAGKEEAWNCLIDKYKRLIYSIPIKYRVRPEDAADIFQNVCMKLLSELANLRKVESLKAWLITVTAHQTFHWMRRQRTGDLELDRPEGDPGAVELAANSPLPPEVIAELEKEQIVRESVAKLPPRCGEMVRLLFYEDPPLPYADLAQRLGLATGSIGFIRGRCLKRLQKILAEMGF